MHALADAHDTPVSWTGLAPGGLGVGLDRPARPVPPLRQRHRVPGAVDVGADGGARARRRARHPRQAAGYRRRQRGWGWAGSTSSSRPTAPPTTLECSVDAEVGADGGAGARRHARHPTSARLPDVTGDWGSAGSPSSSRPTAPPTTRRPCAAEVAADGGARARRHARHPRQLAESIVGGDRESAGSPSSSRPTAPPTPTRAGARIGPTAVHALADTHDTPSSCCPAGVWGVGLDHPARPQRDRRHHPDRDHQHENNSPDPSNTHHDLQSRLTNRTIRPADRHPVIRTNVHPPRGQLRTRGESGASATIEQRSCGSS